ncbi:MAG: T9SS type A sorting domain-containing protein [Bacteroidetes bacterium]|nr:MAG: T9SS type A sorting domain-containing protein [Bacteroidota bacterium]
MKTRTYYILLTGLFLIGMVSDFSAQCLNSSSYGSATASSSTNTTVTISSCSYATEYSTIYGIQAGWTYRCNVSQTTNWVTVRSGSFNGPVVYFGPQGGNWVATVSGTYYAHWNTSSACGTATGCRTTSITTVAAVAAPNPCNSVTAMTCGTTYNYSTSGTGAWNNLGGPYGTPGQERVYSYTPTTSGTHIITANSNSTFVDLFYKAGGSCGSTGWTYLVDLYGTSTFSANFTAGTTYYFLLDDENTSASSGTLSVSCPIVAPSNDNCSSATAITCGQQVSVNNLIGATPDAIGSTSCGTTITSNAVWYRINGNGQYMTASTVGISTVDTKLIVFEGNNGASACNNLTCVDGNDDASGLQSEVSWQSQNGKVYYILAGVFGSSYSGTYNLVVNCTAPPANPCNSITSISCGTENSYSLSGSGVWDGESFYATPGAETIMSYTPSVSGNYSITVTHNNGGWVDLLWKNASNGCGNSGWNYVDDIYSFATNTVYLTAGNTYLFLLDDEDTSPSTGSLNIACPCIGSSVDGSYSAEFSVSGSTVGACNDNSLRSSQDITYAWSVDCAGTYNLSLCGSDFDTYLYLTSSVGSGVIASNDDYCGLQSEITTFLTPGTYYITIEGFGEFSAGNYSLNVSGTTSPSMTTSMNPASCNGFSDGSITASATGGCNIMYSIDGGAFQSSGSFSGLSAGGHTVTAMNSFGNTSSMYVMVTQPAPISVDITSTNPFNGTACIGGAVQLSGNVTGGAGLMNYVWSYENNAGGQTTIPSWSGSYASPYSDVRNASPNATRAYRLTVTSANNAACSAYDEFLVTIIPDPVMTITSSTNVSCNGASDGTATASLSGGLPLNYGINWYSDDNISSNNNPAGDGTLSVNGLFPAVWVVQTQASPSYGCSAQASVTITEPEELVASVTNTDILCNGGTSTVVVSAVGGTLPYSGTGLDIVGAGNYDYTVTDANGCNSMVSVSITEPDQLTLYAGDDAVVYYGYDPMACYTTTAIADGGTPGYDYSWSNGSTEATLSDCPTESVSYVLTVTDANGCSVSDDIWVCVVDVVCQAGNSNNFKVEMCQIPPGNPNNAHTICVDASAVPAHLAIGCTLGACGEQAEICGAPLARTPEKEVAAALSVYPNPTSDLATVSVTLTQGGTYDVSLMDMMGKEIQKIYIGSFEQYENLTFDLDLGHLNSGMYIVTVQQGGSVVENVKVVKQ